MLMNSRVKDVVIGGTGVGLLIAGVNAVSGPDHKQYNKEIDAIVASANSQADQRVRNSFGFNPDTRTLNQVENTIKVYSEATGRDCDSPIWR